MINTVEVLNTYKPILKQYTNVKLKAISSISSVNIFTIPSRIQDKDISSMFKGLLALLREKIQQEQSEKYLNL
ncbi:MAG: hypothetical protein IJA72_00825, partial [Clostridia bacterium]|nr:hypothetical protein [Clostridia bacterium]